MTDDVGICLFLILSAVQRVVDQCTISTVVERWSPGEGNDIWSSVLDIVVQNVPWSSMNTLLLYQKLIIIFIIVKIF